MREAVIVSHVRSNFGLSRVSGFRARRWWVGVIRPGQVFVSHTSDMAQFPEGRSFVQAALDAVSRAGMAPVEMRYFAGREGRPAEHCRQRVRECEVDVAVVGFEVDVAVVGFRYGSVVPGEAVYYTELEFDESGAAGLPRLVFLLADSAGLPVALADADRGAVEGFGSVYAMPGGSSVRSHPTLVLNWRCSTH